MKHLIWLLPLLLLGCPDSARTAGKYEMTAEKVASQVTRYENQEVVCYSALASRLDSASGVGLQCRWKEVVKGSASRTDETTDEDVPGNIPTGGVK